jgi:hypothetical protein
MSFRPRVIKINQINARLFGEIRIAVFVPKEAQTKITKVRIAVILLLSGWRVFYVSGDSAWSKSIM